MRRRVSGGIVGAALGIAAALAIGAPAQAAPSGAADSVCASCHDQAKTFDANPHSRVKGLTGDALCASCHGDGVAHAEAGGDKTKIVRPEGRAGTGICLKCHDAAASVGHRSFKNGVHAQGEAVNCFSCHSVHAAPARARSLLKEAASSTLCASCHGDVAASFRDKPYAHRLGRGGMECSSCHDPHGLPGKGSLKKTRADETPCLSCHAEKRGPFVYEHPGGSAATCTTCHEPHGSNNPRRLVRAEVLQVCLECHSPAGGTLGSQPPSFHNISLARYRNCTTCHTAIHGSSRSPKLLK